MTELSLNRKTGFIIDEPNTPVIINDYRGIRFYSNENLLPCECFNLPAGDYEIISGVFHETSKPFNFALQWLPPSEVLFAPNTSGYKVVFAPNPNKCTIFYQSGELPNGDYYPRHTIVFDDSFADRPLPEVMFIRYHEKGHNYFGYDKHYDMKTAEALCDIYASNTMLKKGYNQSQISEAKESLSSRQQYRKDILDAVLIKNAYK